MKTNNNDAAFSNATDMHGNPTLGPGLTKREYFAAMAMQGIWANPHDVPGKIDSTGASIARVAVMQADALIAELNKDVSHDPKA